jgi:hypothetical protein
MNNSFTFRTTYTDAFGGYDPNSYVAIYNSDTSLYEIYTVRMVPGHPTELSVEEVKGNIDSGEWVIEGEVE